MKCLILLSFLITLSAHATPYPKEWWIEIPASEAPSWEILPQKAKAGEVILSKRTELGVFSNFAATKFCLAEICYASVEGLWQSLKYPDPTLPHDSRHQIKWPHTRAEVEQMVSFEAKHAGDEANLIYKENNLTLVSYEDEFFNYTDYAEGSFFHYVLIKKAMQAKLDQNPAVKTLLEKTKGLILKPDHYVSEKSPASFHYYKILMELRDRKKSGPIKY